VGADDASVGDAGTPDDDDEVEANSELDEPRRFQQAVTNIGTVIAGEFNAGFAEPPTGKRRTGRLSANEIDTALAGYVRPECFDTALDLLATKRLLMVIGAEGTGKRAGALALLRERVMSGPIVGISPIVRAGGLAVYKYRAGRGYLVQDRLPDEGEPAQLTFELQAVARSLAEQAAYLVVTANAAFPSGAWRDFTVRWEHPDPAVLLDACLERLGVAIDERGRDQLLALAREHPSPAQVVEMVRRVRDGGGDLRAAIDSTVDTDRARISEWFNRSPGPTQRQVLFLAALCFAHGLPERLFDGVAGALEDRFTRAAGRGQPEQQAQQPSGDGDKPTGASSGDHALPKTRGNLLAESPIEVVREATPVPGVTLPERRVSFKVSTCRGLVMERLWDLYGRELWDPLTDWMREIARFGAAEARQQIALGVVMLGGLAGQGVLESFLEPWARGYRRERFTAAYALWWSCLDDSLAPLALKKALTWSRQSSPSYQVTAVVALSGQLGVLYPGEAMQALWRLLDGSEVGLLASRAFPELFCALTSATGNGGAVLRFLRNQGVEATGARYDMETRNRLTAVAYRVLAARLARTGNLAAVTTLQTATDQDDLTATAGWLWADLLRFHPLRSEAIDLLEQTLRSLSQAPEGDPLLRSLGDAIAASLSARELSLLWDELKAAFLHATGDGTGTDHTRAFVSALLDALRKQDARRQPRSSITPRDL
jgi:hypothetical protein